MLADGGDTTITGTEPCGDAATCNIATEFCLRTVGGPPPGIDVSECKPFPSKCHDCTCAYPPQKGICTCIDDVGNFTVTCQAP
jgi:hypothetical protein